MDASRPKYRYDAGTLSHGSCRTYVCVATINNRRRDVFFMVSLKLVSCGNMHVACMRRDAALVLS
jgi:hypothetical protein